MFDTTISVGNIIAAAAFLFGAWRVNRAARARDEERRRHDKERVESMEKKMLVISTDAGWVRQKLEQIDRKVNNGTRK